MRALFSCSVALKLAVAAGSTGCQVIARLTLPDLRFAELYVHFRFFLRRRPPLFRVYDLIIVPFDFRFLPDLIRCHPTFELKPTIIIFEL